MLASHAIVHGSAVGLWLQTTDFNSAENTHLLMIFIGILAVSVAIIALAVLVVAFVAARTVKRVMEITEEVKGKSMPIIASTQGVIGTVQRVIDDLQPKIKAVTDDLAPRIKTISEDLQPKIKSVSTSVADMAAIAHKNAARFDETLDEANATVRNVNQKTKAQVDRVDGMISSALTATSHVAQTIHHSIRVPVNQVAGVVNGFKAGLDTLLGSARDLSHTASTKGPGKGISLEGKREEEMERITGIKASGGYSTGAVPTSLGEDMLGGTSVEATSPGSSDGRTMAADVVASQRRAAGLRSAPDASDLAEPVKAPVLPKRFQ